MKADTLFKGETLRSILLNAYGWWTVATIAMYVGVGLIAAGLLLGIFAFLGFRHSRRRKQVVPDVVTTAEVIPDVKIPAGVATSLTRKRFRAR